MEEGLVELLAAGARFRVGRGVGLALFERNTLLMTEGRVEAAQFVTSGEAARVVHLALGAGPIVLAEYPELPDRTADASASADPVGAPARDTADFFLDFDAYGA